MANAEYCSHCGKQFLEDIAFCRFCGAERLGPTSERGAKKATFDAVLHAIENGELAAISVGPEVGLVPGEVCYFAAVGSGCGFFHGIPPIGYLGDLYVTDKRVLFKPNRLASQTPGPTHPELDALSIALDVIVECFESKPSISIVTGRMTANGRAESLTSQLVMPNEEYGKVVLALISKLRLPPKPGQPQQGVFEAQEVKPPQKNPPHLAEPPSSAEGLGGQTANSGGGHGGSGTTPRVKGNVKWFNNAKGYGFAATQNGQDVFVHYSAISGTGFKTLLEGDLVEFEIVQGTHGPMAMSVVKLGEAQTAKCSDGPDGSGSSARVHGSVKWFDNSKGYGFIATQNGHDVFVHHSAISGAGFKTLLEGDLVEFEIVRGPHGPMAAKVEKLGEAQTGTSPQETTAVAPLVANHVRSAFPKTSFEIYIDYARVIHVGWAGSPRTAEVRTFLRGIVLQGQIPNVEFDFQHTDPEVSQEGESTQAGPNGFSAVASCLKSSFPWTTFDVYSQGTNVVHIAWKGVPKTDEVRSLLQTLRLQHRIPNVDFNFHHAETTKPSGSSASGSKSRTKSKARVNAVSQKGPYEILGLSPGASLEEVTKAYRREAQKNHPDKVATMAAEFRELAEKRMKEINAAYEELSRHLR
jgi:cold shock protein